MSKKKFTVITVCYNAEKYIKETIESLLCQNCNDYEYIIKDGISKDRTLEIAHALLDGKDNIQIVSSPDKGIYDAMNQALELATGEYVYFLNAGDYFADKEVLSQTKDVAVKTDGDILYGNIVQISDKKSRIYEYGEMCKSKLYFSMGACICHQAMFAKRVLFEDRVFNITYKVCADREWQLYQMNRKVKMITMDFEVASVLTDGFSSRHIEDFEKEILRCLNVYCSGTAWIYKLILNIKKNRIVLFFMRMVEKILLTKKSEMKR